MVLAGGRDRGRSAARTAGGGGRAAPGMLPAMELNGTAAIVTGGASGLGEATARALAAAGATVVIADLNEDAGKQVASETGGLFARTDVADEASVQAAVDAAAGTGAPLRVAVSCAGHRLGGAHGQAGRHPARPGRLPGVIAVNLTGTFNLMRIAAAAIAETEPADARRPARRDHQHLLGRGDRGADRPDRLLRVQGRDHRDDGARRA